MSTTKFFERLPITNSASLLHTARGYQWALLRSEAETVSEEVFPTAVAAALALEAHCKLEKEAARGKDLMAALHYNLCALAAARFARSCGEA